MGLAQGSTSDLGLGTLRVMSFSTCSGCEGFLPEDADSCPHCEAARERPKASALKRVAASFAGGVGMVTLMACYGLPPDECPECQIGGNGGEAGSVSAGGEGGAGGEVASGGAPGSGGAGGAGAGGAGGAGGAAAGGTGGTGGAP